ncbi:30S ribosomal protein S19 [Candidatus Woesearchaeota archaeon CG10_big_fil_rev_8_21_14_0_10_45_16]|nr:MAG: 30S ribosomal protein S19 [Candidatus Woesearchaeota archaeon CG10_big_fil_rev_8_21_14_0_10_45_16]
MAKELMWKGKSEADVKQIDMKEFMKLIPSRSRRSLQRGLTDQQKALMQYLEAGANNMKTHARNMVITPLMLGKTIRVYNGKDFVPVTCTLEMLGHCLGEFSHTRKAVTHSSAGIGATRSSKSVSAR